MMKTRLTVLIVASLAAQASVAELRGDPAAIAEAEAMVQSMGGAAIWTELQSLVLVHEWFASDRIDAYVEHETLDLTGPRSRADRKSEIRHAIRVYSPEGKGWRMQNGEISYGSEEELQRDLRRAPFNFYRLVKGVAVGDSFYEVRFGPGDVPDTRRIEFYGPDGALGGWVILNARKEPLVKATPEYRYTLGPLQRFGNLRIPAWGVYDNGYTLYQMISATGDRKPPELPIFRAPD